MEPEDSISNIIVSPTIKSATKGVIALSLSLSVFADAMKNLLHPAWVTEHLIFFALGVLLVFALRRMELPRWSLVPAPVLYAICELVCAIDQSGTMIPNLYDITRYLLLFAIGEGAWLLIKLIGKHINKKEQ